jgi:hypothetical protein
MGLNVCVWVLISLGINVKPIPAGQWLDIWGSIHDLSVSIVNDTSRSWSYVTHVDITDMDIRLTTIYISAAYIYKSILMHLYLNK